jgi:zinc/manganese transport system substrate-binding protein
MSRFRLAFLMIAALALLAACGTSTGAGGSGTGSAGGSGGGSAGASGAVRVVAAENFWGSIAQQVGGSKASVQSIIADPAQDPHSYEPTAADARTLATAQLAIVNGIGYDPWAPKLLAANPVGGRLVLTVGSLFGLKEGDNPHRWYDPAEVIAVANTIAADLKKLDPSDAAYFEQQRKTFETRDLASYHALIAQIKSRYAGTPVGASESIFALQAPALGLDLVTPYSFMKAISEGTDVSAQDTLTTQRQITDHRIKVWIYNSQNATPGIQRLNALARAAHIPIATITETLDPAKDSFEQWQVAQLERIEQALHQATGR